MANRLFALAVVSLWLASMTWLVTDRIVPSLFEGEPPVEETYQKGQAVAWSVQWDRQPVGNAASVRLPGAGGSMDLHNRVRLQNIPLMDLAPTWMRTAIGSFGEISFEASTRIEFDALGNFSAFDSRVKVNDLPSTLRMTGRVEDSHLNLNVSSGEMSYKTSVYLPESDSMNEILFPAASLPELYLGRTWREEVYNPFNTPGEPVDLLHAEVVKKSIIAYAGELQEVFVVEYRSLNISGIAQEAQLQAECWVASSGRVLRREVHFGKSTLRFERLEDSKTEDISKELLEDLIRSGAEVTY